MITPQSELVLVSANGAEPLTLEAARLWLRVDQPDEDDLIGGLITAARIYAESFCARSFTVGEQWKMTLDFFPGAELRDSVYLNTPVSELWETPDQYLILRPTALAIEIPMGPVTNIASITYINTEGNQQVLDPAAYEQIPTDNGNLRIFPVFGQGWPRTQYGAGKVTINFGTGTAPSETVILAMKQMISHWYTNREAVIMVSGVTPENVPFAAEMLLWPHRILEV